MSSNASVLGVHGVDEIGIDANQAHQNMLNLVELIPDLRKMGISKEDANEILAIEQQIDEAKAIYLSSRAPPCLLRAYLGTAWYKYRALEFGGDIWRGSKGDPNYYLDNPDYFFNRDR